MLSVYGKRGKIKSIKNPWCSGLVAGIMGLGLLFWGSLAEAATVTSIPLSELTTQITSSETVVPNDPFWNREWYLRQIGADRAWTVTTGTARVVVAVIDAGVDITHPDLRDNIWTNPREQVGDGIDNDRNGFIDDIHGWNFVTDSSDVRPIAKPIQSEEAWSHGTMIASLIGAKGNDGIGMSGVAWNVRIMPLVALDADGSGSTEDIIRAIRYAVSMGANIINLSLAGYEEDPALTEMIHRATSAGVVVVSATGNDDEAKGGVNIDEKPSYPACGEKGEDAVIGVGGTDALDQKAAYANFGKKCTDLSAPAYDLFAARPSYPHSTHGGPTVIQNYRDGVIGTSLAAPLISGAVALLKSVHPDWTVHQLQQRLYATADPLEANQVLGSKTVLGYGRLNIGRALRDPLPETAILTPQPVSASTTMPILSKPKTTAPVKVPVKLIKPLRALTLKTSH